MYRCSADYSFCLPFNIAQTWSSATHSKSSGLELTWHFRDNISLGADIRSPQKITYPSIFAILFPQSVLIKQSNETIFWAQLVYQIDPLINN